MDKKRYKKALLVFLGGCVVTLLYFVTQDGKSINPEKIVRGEGGRQEYHVDWGEESFDFSLQYKGTKGAKEKKEEVKKETLKEEFIQYIHRLERESRQEKIFYLPTSYQGKKIKWSYKKDTAGIWILVIALVLSIWSYKRPEWTEEERQKKREEELTRQYPKLVGVVTALLESGMSMRHVIQKITEEKLGGEGILQEELEILWKKIDSGEGMTRALTQFAEGCNLRLYRKFVGLLLQNQEKGSRGLRQMLLLEVQESEEMRLHHARQEGEKAQTRMLLPLTLLLGLVMLILLAPAYLQMRQL